MSTGEFENHPADDSNNESDDFMESMKSVNYKVYEVSKLVNRIYQLDKRITLRIKWMKLSNRIIRVFNTKCRTKFANLSKSYDEIVIYYKRNWFLRWKARYKWIKFARIQLSNERHSQFQDLIPEILEHKQKIKIKRWELLTKKLLQSEKSERIRLSLEEHEYQVKLQYFFDIWINRYFRKQEIKKARSLKWISIVYHYLLYCQRNELIHQHNRIIYRNNWRRLMNNIIHKNVVNKLNRALSYDRNYTLFTNLVIRYQHQRRTSILISAESRLRQTENWNYFIQSLLLSYYTKTFRKAKLASDTAAKIRSMANQLLQNDQRELLLRAQKKRHDKVEARRKLQVQKDYLYFWFQRAIGKRSTRRLMRFQFSNSINEYMFSVCNHSAITIQRWFRSILHKQKVANRLLFNCFQSWRKLSLSLTFNSVEFPEMSIKVNTHINFDLDCYRPEYNMDFSVLKPLYERNFVYRNAVIDEVTKNNALSIPLSIDLTIPQPLFSMKPFLCARFISHAVKTLDQKREADINSEPIPFNIDFFKPMQFVSSFVPENAEKIKEEEYVKEPGINDDFLNHVAQTATKRKLRKVEIPLSVKNGCTDTNSLQRIGSAGEMPDLLDQYGQLFDLKDPNFSMLLNVYPEALDKFDQYEPNDIPMNYDFAIDALNEIDVSPIYRISNDTVTVEPLPEVTKIEEKEENKVDDDLYLEAVENMGLEKTTDEVVKLYDEQFDYIKREEYWKLLIYDRSIEEEAAQQINFDDVYITAALLLNDPIKALPPYEQIEPNILEKKLEIDEKRVEKPLLDVYKEIKIDPFSIDFFGPSPYSEKHPEDELDFELPIQELNIESPFKIFYRIRSRRFVSGDIAKMAKYYLSTFSLTNDDLINFNYLIHIAPFELSLAEEMIFKPMKDPLLPERVVKKTITFVNSNDCLSMFDPKVLLPIPSFKQFYTPESTKPKFDDIYDTEIPDSNELIDVMPPLLLNNMSIIGQKEPNVDDIDRSNELEEKIDNQIFQISTKKRNAIEYLLPKEVPEIEYIDDIEFELFDNKIVNADIFTDFTKSDIPDKEIQIPIDERASDVSEDLFKDQEYKIIVNKKDHNSITVFKLNDPIEDPLKDVVFDDVLSDMINELTINPFANIPVNVDLSNYVPIEHKEETIPDTIDDSFVSVDKMNIDMNLPLNHLSNILWENVHCEQMYKYFINEPELVFDSIEVKIDSLERLIYKPPLFKDLVPEDIFDDTVNDFIRSIGESKVKFVYESLVVPEKEEEIPEEFSIEIANEIFDELDSVFSVNLKDMRMKQANEIDIICKQECPINIEIMLNQVIDESLSFMKTEEDIIDDDFKEKIGKEIEEAFAPDQFVELTAKSLLDGAFLQAPPIQVSFIDLLSNVIDDSLKLIKNEESDNEIEFNEDDFNLVDIDPTVNDILIAKKNAIDSNLVPKDSFDYSKPINEMLDKVIYDELNMMKSKPTVEPEPEAEMYELPSKLDSYISENIKAVLTDISVIHENNINFFPNADESEEEEEEEEYYTKENVIEYSLPESIIENQEQGILSDIININIMHNEQISIDTSNLTAAGEEEEESVEPEKPEIEESYDNLPENIITHIDESIISTLNTCIHQDIELIIPEKEQSEGEESKEEPETETKEEEAFDNIPESIITYIDETIIGTLNVCSHQGIELIIQEASEEAKEEEEQPQENVIEYSLPESIIENEEQGILSDIVNINIMQNEQINIGISNLATTEEEPEQKEKEVESETKEEPEKEEETYDNLPEDFIKHIEETISSTLNICAPQDIELIIQETGESETESTEEPTQEPQENAIEYSLPESIIENEEQGILSDIVNINIMQNEQINIDISNLATTEEEPEEKEIESETKEEPEAEKEEETYENLPEDLIKHIEETISSTLNICAPQDIELIIQETDETETEEPTQEPQENAIEYSLPESIIENEEQGILSDIVNINIMQNEQINIDISNLATTEEEPEDKEKEVESGTKEEPEAEKEEETYDNLPKDIIKQIEEAIVSTLNICSPQDIELYITEVGEAETTESEEVKSDQIDKMASQAEQEPEIEKEEETYDNLPKEIIKHVEETIVSTLDICAPQDIELYITEVGEAETTEEKSEELEEAPQENVIEYSLPESIIENEEQGILSDIVNINIMQNEQISIGISNLATTEEEPEQKEKEIKSEQEQKSETEKKEEETYENLPDDLIKHIEETIVSTLNVCSPQDIELIIQETGEAETEEPTQEPQENVIEYSLPESIIENEEQGILSDIISINIMQNEQISIGISNLATTEEEPEQKEKEVESETKEEPEPEAKKEEETYDNLPEDLIKHIEETISSTLNICAPQDIELIIQETGESEAETTEEPTQEPQENAIEYSLPESIIENEEQGILSDIVNINIMQNEQINIDISNFATAEEEPEDKEKEIEKGTKEEPEPEAKKEEETYDNLPNDIIKHIEETIVSTLNICSPQNIELIVCGVEMTDQSGKLETENKEVSEEINQPSEIEPEKEEETYDNLPKEIIKHVEETIASTLDICAPQDIELYITEVGEAETTEEKSEELEEAPQENVIEYSLPESIIENEEQGILSDIININIMQNEQINIDISNLATTEEEPEQKEKEIESETKEEPEPEAKKEEETYENLPEDLIKHIEETISSTLNICAPQDIELIIQETGESETESTEEPAQEPQENVIEYSLPESIIENEEQGILSDIVNINIMQNEQINIDISNLATTEEEPEEKEIESEPNEQQVEEPEPEIEKEEETYDNLPKDIIKQIDETIIGTLNIGATQDIELVIPLTGEVETTEVEKEIEEPQEEPETNQQEEPIQTEEETYDNLPKDIIKHIEETISSTLNICAPQDIELIIQETDEAETGTTEEPIQEPQENVIEYSLPESIIENEEQGILSDIVNINIMQNEQINIDISNLATAEEEPEQKDIHSEPNEQQVEEPEPEIEKEEEAYDNLPKDIIKQIDETIIGTLNIGATQDIELVIPLTGEVETTEVEKEIEEPQEEPETNQQEEPIQTEEETYDNLPKDIIKHIDESISSTLDISANQNIEFFIQETGEAGVEPTEEKTEEPAQEPQENVIEYSLPESIIENEEQGILSDIVNINVMQNEQINIDISNLATAEEEPEEKEKEIESEPNEQQIEEPEPEIEKEEETYDNLPKDIIKQIDEAIIGTLNIGATQDIELVIPLTGEVETTEVEKEIEEPQEEPETNQQEEPIQTEEETYDNLPKDIIKHIEETISSTLNICAPQDIELIIQETDEAETGTTEEPTQEPQENVIEYSLPELIIENEEQGILSDIVNINIMQNEQINIDISNLATTEEEPSENGIKPEPEEEPKEIAESEPEVEKKEETYDNLPKDIIKQIDETIIGTLNIGATQDIEFVIPLTGEVETTEVEKEIEEPQEEPETNQQEEPIQTEEETYDNLPKDIIKHIDESISSTLDISANQNIEFFIPGTIEESNEPEAEKEVEQPQENVIEYSLPESIIENEEQGILCDIVNINVMQNEQISIDISNLATTEEEPEEAIEQEKEKSVESEPEKEEPMKDEEAYDLPKEIIMYIDETIAHSLGISINPNVEFIIQEAGEAEEVEEPAQEPQENVIEYSLPESIIENEEQGILSDIVNINIMQNEQINIDISNLATTEEEPIQEEQEPSVKSIVSEPKEEPEPEKEQETYDSLPKELINQVEESLVSTLNVCINQDIELFIPEIGETEPIEVSNEQKEKVIEQEPIEEPMKETEQETLDNLPKSIISHVEEVIINALSISSNQNIEFIMNEAGETTEESNEPEAEKEVEEPQENVVEYSLPESIIENEEQGILCDIANINVMHNEQINIDISNLATTEEEPVQEEQEPSVKSIESEPKEEPEPKKEQETYDSLPKSILEHIDDTIASTLSVCTNQEMELFIPTTGETEAAVESNEPGAERETEPQEDANKTEEQPIAEEETYDSLPKEIITYIDETIISTLGICPKHDIELFIQEAGDVEEAEPEVEKKVEERAQENVIEYSLPESIIENEEQGILSDIVNINVMQNEQINIDISNLATTEEEPEEANEEQEPLIEPKEEKTEEPEDKEKEIESETKEEPEKEEETYENLPEDLIKHIEETITGTLNISANQNIELIIPEAAGAEATEESNEPGAERETEPQEDANKTEEQPIAEEETYDSLPKEIITYIDETIISTLGICPKHDIEFFIQETGEAEAEPTKEKTEEPVQEPQENVIEYSLPESIIENEEQGILSDIVNINVMHNEQINIDISNLATTEEEPEEANEEQEPLIEPKEEKTEEPEPEIEKEEETYDSLPKELINQIEETITGTLNISTNQAIELFVQEIGEIEPADDVEKKVEQPEEIENSQEAQPKSETEPEIEAYDSLPKEVISQIEESIVSTLNVGTSQNIELFIQEIDETKPVEKEVEEPAQEPQENVIEYSLPESIIENEEQGILCDIVNINVMHNEQINIDISNLATTEEEPKEIERESVEEPQEVEEPKEETEIAKEPETYENLPQSIVQQIDETIIGTLNISANQVIELFIPETADENKEPEKEKEMEPQEETEATQEEEPIKAEEPESYDNLPKDIITHIDEAILNTLSICTDQDIEFFIPESGEAEPTIEIEAETEKEIEQQQEEEPVKAEEEPGSYDNLPKDIIAHIDEIVINTLSICTNQDIEFFIQETGDEVAPEENNEPEVEKEAEPQENVIEYSLPESIIENEEQGILSDIININIMQNEQINIDISNLATTEEEPEQKEKEIESEPVEEPKEIAEEEPEEYGSLPKDVITHIDEIIINTLNVSANNDIELFIPEIGETTEPSIEPKSERKIEQQEETEATQEEEPAKTEEPESYDSLPKDIITHIDETILNTLSICTSPDIEFIIPESGETEPTVEAEAETEKEIEQQEETEATQEEEPVKTEEPESYDSLPKDIISHIDEIVVNTLSICTNQDIEFFIQEAGDEVAPEENNEPEVEKEAEPQENVIEYSLPESIIENEEQGILSDIVNINVMQNEQINIDISNLATTEKEPTEEKNVESETKEESEKIAEPEAYDSLPEDIIKHIDETILNTLNICTNPDIEFFIPDTTEEKVEPTVETEVEAETKKEIEQQEETEAAPEEEPIKAEEPESYDSLPKDVITHIDETILSTLILGTNQDIEFIIPESGETNEPESEEQEVKKELEPKENIIEYSLPESIIENEEQVILGDIINIIYARNEQINLDISNLSTTEEEPQEEPIEEKNIESGPEEIIEPEIEPEPEAYDSLPEDIIKHIDETILNTLNICTSPDIEFFIPDTTEEKVEPTVETEVEAETEKEIEQQEETEVTQEEEPIKTEEPESYDSLPEDIITHIDETILNTLNICTSPDIEFFIQETTDENKELEAEPEIEREIEQQEEAESTQEEEPVKAEEPKEEPESYDSLPKEIISHIDETITNTLNFGTNQDIEFIIPESGKTEPTVEVEAETEKEIEQQEETEATREEEPAKAEEPESYDSLPKDIITHIDETILNTLNICTSPDIEFIIPESGETEPTVEVEAETEKEIEQQEETEATQEEEPAKTEEPESYDSLPKDIITHIDETILNTLNICTSPDIEFIIPESGETEPTVEVEAETEKEIEQQEETEAAQEEEPAKTEEPESYDSLPKDVITYIDETILSTLILGTNQDIEFIIPESGETNEPESEEQEVKKELEPKENIIEYSLPESIIENEEQVILGDIINIIYARNEQINLDISNLSTTKEEPQEEPIEEKNIESEAEEDQKEIVQPEPQIEKEPETYSLPKSFLDQVDETLVSTLNICASQEIEFIVPETAEESSKPEPKIEREMEPQEETEAGQEEEPAKAEEKQKEEPETYDCLPKGLITHIDETIKNALSISTNQDIEFIIPEANAEGNNEPEAKLERRIETQEESQEAEQPTEDEPEQMKEPESYDSLPKDIITHVDELIINTLNIGATQDIEFIIPESGETETAEESNEPEAETETRNPQPQENLVEYSLPPSIIENVEQGILSDILSISLAANEQINVDTSNIAVSEEEPEEEQERARDFEPENDSEPRIESKQESYDSLPKSVANYIDEAIINALNISANQDIEFIIPEAAEEGSKPEAEKSGQSQETAQAEPQGNGVEYSLPHSIIENEEQGILGDILSITASQNEQLQLDATAISESSDAVVDIQPRPRVASSSSLGQGEHHSSSEMSNRESQGSGFVPKAAVNFFEQSIKDILNISAGNNITFYILNGEPTTDEI